MFPHPYKSNPFSLGRPIPPPRPPLFPTNVPLPPRRPHPPMFPNNAPRPPPPLLMFPQPHFPPHMFPPPNLLFPSFNNPNQFPHHILRNNQPHQIFRTHNQRPPHFPPHALFPPHNLGPHFPFRNFNHSDNIFNHNNKKNGKKGFDKNFLDSLEINKIKDVNKLDDDKKKCTICLEDYANGDESIILPCIHLFHANCIKTWMENNNTCPLCNNEIKYENE